jgi:hypothetical protein
MKRKVETFLKQTYGEQRSKPDPADGHFTFSESFSLPLSLSLCLSLFLSLSLSLSPSLSLKLIPLRRG